MKRGDFIKVRNSPDEEWQIRIAAWFSSAGSDDRKYIVYKETNIERIDFERSNFYPEERFYYAEPINLPIIEITIAEIAKLKGVYPSQIRIKSH